MRPHLTRGATTAFQPWSSTCSPRYAGLCFPPSPTVPSEDAGKCLGIFYATVAHLVL
jgi:hypothetical protein